MCVALEANEFYVIVLLQLQLNISLTPREVNAKDPRGTLQTIFQKWIPLSEAVLKMVVRNIPDPRSAQKRKMATLFAPSEEDALTDQDIGMYIPHSEYSLNEIAYLYCN
jgi:translation elongation factor EF-G